MIIKALSSEENATARLARNLAQLNSKEPVPFIPYGIDGLFITSDEETERLKVVASDEAGNDLSVTYGFYNLQECWDYARVVAKEAGLPDAAIEADKFDDDLCYTLVSIYQNDRGLYQIHGQILMTDGQMEIRFLGTYRTLEEARKEAEDIAMEYDCPLVELVRGSRGRLRDLYAEFLKAEANSSKK